MCRGAEGGFTIWPDAGGLNDQACFVVAAFNVLNAAESEYREWKKSARNG